MAKVKRVPARKIDRWLWLAGIVIVLDQLSKWLVLARLQPGDSVYVAPFFNWVLTYNAGAAFSFLSDAGGWQRWFFTGLALAIAMCVIIVICWDLAPGISTVKNGERPRGLPGLKGCGSGLSRG